MARIKIEDLKNVKPSEDELQRVHGGASSVRTGLVDIRDGTSNTFYKGWIELNSVTQTVTRA